MKPQSHSGSLHATSAISVNDLCFIAGSYNNDVWMPLHAHDYAHFVFGLKGEITQTCRKDTLLLEPGSLVFLPPEEPHATHFRQEVCLFQILLKPKWIERLQVTSALLRVPVHYEKGLPIWVAMRLYREFQNRDNLTSLMLEGLLLELLTVTTRHHSNAAENRVPRWLREARDLLHARFTESLSLDQIASSVGVHPSHLMDGFRQHYHCTVGDYVRQLRVEYATHLLAASDLPASQIAFSAGFADQSHFSRTFRRLTGMTPMEFKKAIR